MREDGSLRESRFLSAWRTIPKQKARKHWRVVDSLRQRSAQRTPRDPLLHPSILTPPVRRHLDDRNPLPQLNASPFRKDSDTPVFAK
jgi:hypothetical protein